MKLQCREQLNHRLARLDGYGAKALCSGNPRLQPAIRASLHLLTRPSGGRASGRTLAHSASAGPEWSKTRWGAADRECDRQSPADHEPLRHLLLFLRQQARAAFSFSQNNLALPSKHCQYAQGKLKWPCLF